MDGIMKIFKKFIYLFVVVLLLAGCKKTEEDITLNIMIPLGSPALSQTYMQSTMPSLGENVNYSIDIVSGTDPLIAAFASESHNIIYAPTNLGAKLISTGVNYSYAGTVVWGNLYLATGTDIDFTVDSLEGKEIILFGQNSTPDIAVQTIINSYEFTIPPTITYVDSAGTALATLVADNSKIVLLAEPVLSVAALPSNVANIKVIDIQFEWEKLTGDSSYPQAGIFVHNDLDIDVVHDYLSAVENSILQTEVDPAAVAQMAVDLDYGFPLPVLIGAIPRSHLEFKNAQDSRDAMEIYFNYILEFNPALIGGALPGDSFYIE